MNRNLRLMVGLPALFLLLLIAVLLEIGDLTLVIHPTAALMVLGGSLLWWWVAAPEPGGNPYIQPAWASPLLALLTALIGVIGLLANLSSIASIGPGMATVLIALLYGGVVQLGWIALALHHARRRGEGLAMAEVVNGGALVGGVLLAAASLVVVFASIVVE